MELQASDLQKHVEDVVQELLSGSSGYAVVRGMVPAEIVAEARSVVHRSFPCRLSRFMVKIAQTAQIKMTVRTFDLVSRSHAFVKLLDNESLNGVIAGVCGESAKCGSYHANTVPPASSASQSPQIEFVGDAGLAQELHIDYPYGRGHASFLEGRNPPADAPRTCQVLWMLDDFTKENGATVLVPGTHKQCSPTESDKDMAYAVENHVRLTGHAGDMLIYSGQLWHAVPHNYSSASRTAVLGQFLPYYFLSMEDHAKATPEGVLKALPPRVQNLFVEHVSPSGMWLWFFAPPLSLVRRILDVIMSPMGIVGVLGTSLITALCCQWPQSNPLPTMIIACGAFFMGCFSTLTHRDLKFISQPHPQPPDGQE